MADVGRMRRAQPARELSAGNSEQDCSFATWTIGTCARGTGCDSSYRGAARVA
jgi:hypothetical protein